MHFIRLNSEKKEQLAAKVLQSRQNSTGNPIGAGVMNNVAQWMRSQTIHLFHKVD